MRAQRRTVGCVRYDKRRGTWNYLFYDQGKRRSKRIGTKKDYPTKAAAWNAVKPLQDALEIVNGTAVPTVQDVASRYETEKMPTRANSRRNSRSWLKNHVLPKWGQVPVG